MIVFSYYLASKAKGERTLGKAFELVLIIFFALVLIVGVLLIGLY
jgi:hypothetical protein